LAARPGRWTAHARWPHLGLQPLGGLPSLGCLGCLPVCWEAQAYTLRLGYSLSAWHTPVHTWRLGCLLGGWAHPGAHMGLGLRWA